MNISNSSLWGKGLSFRLFFVLFLILSSFVLKMNVNYARAAGDVTLTGSAFSDPDAEDTHNASQWIVERNDTGAGVYDSGADAANLTTITISGATFTAGVTYKWKVRYQDQHLVWSDYSAYGLFVYGGGDPTATPTPDTPTPTPVPSGSPSSTPVPSPSATQSCMFGWTDWNGNGIDDDSCGDPQPINAIYVPENQVDFCAGSKVKLTYYYSKTNVSGGGLKLLEEYQKLADKTSGDGAPVHDIYLSTDGGAVYTRIATDIDPMPGATIEDLPLPIKDIAKGHRASPELWMRYLKVTHYVTVPKEMISDPSKARFLVYVRNQSVHHVPDPDFKGISLNTGGVDLGNILVAPNIADSYTFYAGPNPPGDVMDYSNSVELKKCSPDTVASPSPIPPPKSDCSYDITSPKDEDVYQSEKINTISWILKPGAIVPKPGGTATDMIYPSSANSMIPFLPPEKSPDTGNVGNTANVYLSKNNNAPQQIGNGITTNSYDYFFSSQDESNKSRIRLDHLDSNGNIYSTCYSSIFSVRGSGGGGGCVGLECFEETYIPIIVLGSLFAAIASLILSGVSAFPVLQKLFSLASAPVWPASAQGFLGLTRLFAPPAVPSGRHAWGIVYDSSSKKPIEKAIIRVFSEPGDKLRATVRSNASGQFGFVLPDGIYSILVSKNGFEFPTRLVVGMSDGGYTNLYKGGKFEVHGDGIERAQVNFNIPLDRSNLSTYDIVQFKTFATISSFFRAIRMPVLILGTIAAAYLVFTQGRAFDYGVGVLYIILWGIEIASMIKKRAYGLLRDQQGNPVSLAVIRVTNARNQLISTIVSGEDGKFQANLDPGEYRLEISRAGYRKMRTELFKISKIQDIGRLDIHLTKF